MSHSKNFKVILIFFFLPLSHAIMATNFTNPNVNTSPLTLSSGDTLTITSSFPIDNFQVLTDGNTTITIQAGAVLQNDLGPVIKTLSSGTDTGPITINNSGQIRVTNYDKCMELSDSLSSQITVNANNSLGNILQTMHLNSNAILNSNDSNTNGLITTDGQFNFYNYAVVGGDIYTPHLIMQPSGVLTVNGQFQAKTFTNKGGLAITGPPNALLTILNGDLTTNFSLGGLSIKGVPGKGQTLHVQNSYVIGNPIGYFDILHTDTGFTNQGMMGPFKLATFDNSSQAILKENQYDFNPSYPFSTLLIETVDNANFVLEDNSYLKVDDFKNGTIAFTGLNAKLYLGSPLSYNNPSKPQSLIGIAGNAQLLSLTHSSSWPDNSGITNVDAVQVENSGTLVTHDNQFAINNFKSFTLDPGTRFNLKTNGQLSGLNILNNGTFNYNGGLINSNFQNVGIINIMGSPNMTGDLELRSYSSIGFNLSNLQSFDSLNVLGQLNIQPNTQITLNDWNANIKVGEKYKILTVAHLSPVDPNQLLINSNGDNQYLVDLSEANVLQLQVLKISSRSSNTSPSSNTFPLDEALTLLNLPKFLGFFQQTVDTTELANQLAKTNPDLLNTLKKINESSDNISPEEVLTPKYAYTKPLISEFSNNQLINKVQLQLDYNMNQSTGLSTGDEPRPPFFMTPLFFISHLRADAIDTYSAFRALTVGAGLMLEQALFDNYKIGTALGWVKTGVKYSSNPNNRSHTTGYQGLLFASGVKKRWSGDLIASMTQNHYTNQRHIPLPNGGLIADSNPEGEHHSFKINVAYLMPISSINLYGLMHFNKNIISIKKYQETGAGGLNQTVQSHTADVTRAGLGLRMIHKTHTNRTLEAHCNYYQDLNRPKNTVLASLNGLPADFITSAPRNKMSSYNLGFSIQKQLKQFNCSLNYEFDHKGYLSQNSLFLHLKFEY